jgi:sigma-E factor negative regulatory protein RseA
MNEFKAELEAAKANHAVSPVLAESLSAMMDDEADALELRRIVKAVPASPELAKTWQRYHAVRASLKQELPSNPRANLLPAIHAQLAREGHGMPAQRPAQRKLWQFVGQGAIAASVAAAVLLGASFFNQAPERGIGHCRRGCSRN